MTLVCYQITIASLNGESSIVGEKKGFFTIDKYVLKIHLALSLTDTPLQNPIEMWFFNWILSLAHSDSHINVTLFQLAHLSSANQSYSWNHINQMWFCRKSTLEQIHTNAYTRTHTHRERDKTTAHLINFISTNLGVRFWITLETNHKI